MEIPEAVATPGEIIARYRAAVFLSPRSLGALLGISTDTVQRIEKGSHGPSYRRHIERIIDLLNITDPTEQAVLWAAGKPGEEPQDHEIERDTSPRFAVVREEADPQPEDTLLHAMCIAIERGSVTDAHAADFAKQVQFMRDGAWHSD